MKKLRVLIGEVTGYYFRKIPFSEAFYTISKDGKLDHRLKSTLLAALCDWLEEFEKEFITLKGKTKLMTSLFEKEFLKVRRTVANKGLAKKKK